MQCECFSRGNYCPSDCKCPDCHNNSRYDDERTKTIEKILLENPLAFTSKDSLNQEEYSAISKFARLTNSIDSEPFMLKESKRAPLPILKDKVLDLSFVTILSAAFDGANIHNEKTIDEEAELTMVTELERTLKLFKESNQIKE